MKSRLTRHALACAILVFAVPIAPRADRPGLFATLTIRTTESAAGAGSLYGLPTGSASVLSRRAAVAAGQAEQAATLTRQAAGGEEPDVLRIFHTISSHDMLGWATELSSDRFNGRASGTEDYESAARWVADKLQSWGIAPYGDDGTYFQWFSNPYTIVRNAGSLTLMAPENGTVVIDRRYEFPQDFYPGVNSASGSVTGEVVYVGYGITAPELGYDDYAGVDVKGKIVLVDPDLPYTKQDDAFPGWVPYSFHQYKQLNALKHGAVGMLYIGRIANPNTLYQPGFVYAHVGSRVVDDLFAGSSTSHEDLLAKIAATLRPASFATGKRVTITASTEHHAEGRSCNVIGLIEGSDPVLKHQVIIVGGHLDGVGNLGVVFPGALDNASGVADVLGAAKALAAMPVKPARSIMFLLTGGEECGLVGSTFYTEHPKVSREQTVAFFNLDMAGNGTGLSVVGGLTFPKILEYFEEANSRYVHRIFSATQLSQSAGRPRSDAVIFRRAGYRALGLGTTGDTGVRTYYHDPDDTWKTLTPEIMEDLSRVMFLGLYWLANSPGTTTFG